MMGETASSPAIFRKGAHSIQPNQQKAATTWTVAEISPGCGGAEKAFVARTSDELAECGNFKTKIARKVEHSCLIGRKDERCKANTLPAITCRSACNNALPKTYPYGHRRIMTANCTTSKWDLRLSVQALPRLPSRQPTSSPVVMDRFQPRCCLIGGDGKTQQKKIMPKVLASAHRQSAAAPARLPGSGKLRGFLLLEVVDQFPNS